MQNPKEDNATFAKGKRMQELAAKRSTERDILINFFNCYTLDEISDTLWDLYINAQYSSMLDGWEPMKRGDLAMLYNDMLKLFRKLEALTHENRPQ